MAHSISGNTNEVAYVSPDLAVANISYPFLPVELYSFLLYLQDSSREDLGRTEEDTECQMQCKCIAISLLLK